MAISIKDVEHIAWLARLALTHEEKEKFAGQLSNILEHAGKISELNLKNVAPTSHAVPVSNVFRDDVSGPCLEQDEALANAPKREDGGFVVPKIVGEPAAM
ncbi:MAG: Asp-tRNA(Asn)/Glu-tRNA(Gln) amidotransferase subunit GatC [Actinobacteria bacterium]|nr:Asp-tRNA(Asn)/Glu-tRNA(Gln) amidotransferase subunit GatC [Actinomycetota bacterium]